MKKDDAQAAVAGIQRRDVRLLAADQIEFHPRFANVRGANEGDVLGDVTQLQESIATLGLRQPLDVVQQFDSAGGSHYYLAAGFRRLQALRNLAASGHALDLIPCLVEAGTDADFVYRNLAENIHRADVNAADVARRIFDVVETTATPTATVARNLSRSERWVRSLVATVRECEPEIIEAARADKIGMRVAYEHFRGHPRDVQLRLLDVAMGVAEATGKTEAALLRATGKAVRLELAAIEQAKLAETKMAEPADSDNVPKEPQSRTKAPAESKEPPEPGEPAPLDVLLRETPPPPSLPPQAQPAGPTGMQLRERLVVLQNAVARMMSDDASQAKQVASLQYDLSVFPNKETAATATWIDGFMAAVFYAQGSTCSLCGKPVVTIIPGSSELPQQHWCDE